MIAKDCQRKVKLLVSVRSAAEAVDALRGGADIIDIKEPSRGPLGRADGVVIASIIQAVGGERLVSAALGELAELTDGSSRLKIDPAGLSFAKVGLSGMPAGLAWRESLTQLYDRMGVVRPVAVVYADLVSNFAKPSHHNLATAHPPLEDVISWAIDRRAAGLLLDTTAKDGRNLFDFLDESTIRSVQRTVQSAGLFIALAGSLRDQSLHKALALEPDIVAVRGAACVQGVRHQSIDRERVRALASLIAEPRVTTSA